MYAVIEQGSKQYKVSKGDVINIELVEVPADAKTIELGKVLFVSDGQKVQVGTPYLDGAKVVASFKVSAEESTVCGPKLYPTMFRRRCRKKRLGHKQRYMQVIIEGIEA